MRNVNHRVIGNNAVPREVRIDSLQDALQLIGKGGDAQRFANLVELTRDRFPQLLPLLEWRPLEICELAKKCPVLLDVVAWMQQNPRPGIYLRQIDVPVGGVMQRETVSARHLSWVGAIEIEVSPRA